MALPAGPEYAAKYTLTGPDGTVAVFNDSTSPNFVGSLSPESSGLDSADVRESAVDAVEEDGGVHGNFYYGRRPVVLQGTIIATSAEDRNKKAAKLQAASNAMRGDATLKWTPAGGEELELKLRRQQPVRITKGFVKEFQIPMVSATATINAISATKSLTFAVATKSPASVVSATGIGTTAWTNPENAKVFDGIYATNTIAASGGISNYLKATKFGFAIPGAAEIRDIEVECVRRDGLETIKDNTVQLVKNNVIGGSSIPITTKWGNAGSLGLYKAAALWGLVMAPADINAENFGAALSAKNESGGPVTGSVDSFVINVIYTTTTGVEVVNNGNATARPIIKITGPVTNPTITNSTTGEVLTISATIAAGHYITVDFNNRTVIKDGTTSEYSIIVFASSVWWGLRPGANIINLGGSSTSAATKLDVTYASAWV